MKKLFILWLFLAVIVSNALSQTYLKGNAMYWALGITNASIETKVSDRVTFNGDLVFSPWKSVNDSPFLFGQIIPEFRFYPKGAFNGFYAGAFGAFQQFKMTKWNYINTGLYQKGYGYAFGGTIGYEVPINDRWMVDIYAGAGWQNSHYKGFYTETKERYVGWNGSGEWIPYKLGAAFSYKLGRKKKNK